MAEEKKVKSCEAPSFSIFLRITKGYSQNTICLKVNHNVTIRDIIKIIEKNTGLNANQYNISHQSKLLIPSNPLSHYNIVHDSNIFITLKLEPMQPTLLKQLRNNDNNKRERDYINWQTADVVDWIRFIENGKFNDPKYKNFIKRIIELQIDGQKFKDMNDKSTLMLIGLTEAHACQILINHIKRVIAQENGESYHNNCAICVKNHVDCILTPCGHKSCCYDCYQKRKDAFNNKCPICRNEITNAIQTFMNGI